MKRRACFFLATGLLIIGLAGCKTLDGPRTEVGAPVDLAAAPNQTDQSDQPDQVDFADLLPEETFRRGLQHFNRGEYGLAERYLRETVEKSPHNAAAWVALAASYDRNRRFDLADRAYSVAIGLSGETVQILNNQGYSYMLRGDFTTAAAKFRKALRKEPGNATVANNIRILQAQRRANRQGP
jgi:Flp pilus assembly protein TadD